MILAYKLVIKRVDDSVYWTETFKTEAEALAWLATEQTRPYWIESYTHTITPIMAVLRAGV